MKLSVTIIAGAYRATDREIIMRQAFIEQPGDLIVQVTADDLSPHAAITSIVDDLLRQAEKSVARMTVPARYPGKGGTQE